MAPPSHSLLTLPPSALQGQNHITAASRAFYFVLLGFMALCIDLALEHMEVFSPLCVYGFNVNSRSILVFVRDGLLSMSACLHVSVCLPVCLSVYLSVCLSACLSSM